MIKVIVFTFLLVLYSAPARAVDMQVSAFVDFNIGSYIGTGDIDMEQNLCVYANSRTKYNVTITDGSAGAGFNMVHNTVPSEQIPVTVFWNDRNKSAGNTQVTKDVALTKQSNPNETTGDYDCSVNGMTANLAIHINELDIQSAIGGGYSQTLSVTVAFE